MLPTGHYFMLIICYNCFAISRDSACSSLSTDLKLSPSTKSIAMVSSIVGRYSMAAAMVSSRPLSSLSKRSV